MNLKVFLWNHDGPSGWFFVSLPTEISTEIRSLFQWQEEDWGRLKVKAEVKNQVWDTAIWFDTKQQTYLLPIKAEIRKKGKLEEKDLVTIRIFI